MTVFDRPLTGFRFAEILFGDTLQSIAARELGDATRWVELIAINFLVPPYLADQTAVGVLAYGGQILVPAPSPIISTATDPDRVFEKDILLGRDGSLSDLNGDFAVVSGRDNLRQAIKNRVETERGELIYHQDYGSLVRRLIGAVNGPTAALLAAQYVSSAVLGDPRVAKVTKSVAQVNGDVISVSLEFQPVVGRQIELEVVP